MLQPPRVLVYNDGRHSHTYGYEPPMGVRQFREPVDELVGSGADTLLYCVGDTRVLLYDTKVGETWGHNTSDFDLTTWYRPKVNLEKALQQGIDPLEVVCQRGNDKGIRILPTVLLNTCSWEDRSTVFNGRCSDFCFDHPEYCIDFEGGNYRFDYNLPEVRAQQMAVIQELLERYSSDGVELSFLSDTPFGKTDQIDQLRTTLTEWLAEIHEVARRASADQKRQKIVACRIPALWDACNEIGLDVSSWVGERVVDWLNLNTVDPVGQLDQDMPLGPFVESAQHHDVKVFAILCPTIQNDWYKGATKEMCHAAAANAYSQGVDGLMLCNFWPTAHPWSDADYGIIRHMGHPDLLERKDKRFRVRSQTQRDARTKDSAPFGYGRQLPATLTQGQTGPDIAIRVADDLSAALAEQCLDSVTLTVRVTDICPEDELRFTFNDRELPRSYARVSDYTFKIGYVRQEANLGSHYWFDFSLPEEFLPHQGHNIVRVDLLKRAPALSRFVPVTVHDVEITVGYRPHRHAPKQFRRYADAP